MRARGWIWGGTAPPTFWLPLLLSTYKYSPDYDKIALRGGDPRGGDIFHKLFHRKSTAFQEAIERVESRLKDCEHRIDRQLNENKANLLEFADLSNKTRRLYLRLCRLTKIEQEPASSPEPVNGQEPDPATTAREVREAIDRTMEA